LGGAHFQCNSCVAYTITLLLSIPSIIAGLIIGIHGLIRKNSKNNLELMNCDPQRYKLGRSKAIASLILGIASIILIPLPALPFIRVIFRMFITVVDLRLLFVLIFGTVGIMKGRSAGKIGYRGGLRTAGLTCSIAGILGIFLLFYISSIMI